MASSSYEMHNNNTNGHSIDSLSASSLLSHYNANIDLTLKISDLYQLAIKNYLNKSFNKSWDLVIEILNKPISNIDDELAIKVYKLYLSLYDLMLKKEFLIDNRIELTDKFHKGQLYTELSESSIDDTELYLIVFIIERANELDLQMLSTQLEQFLETATTDVNDQIHLKIIKFYLFSVLPYLNQYEKAESVIMKQFYMEDDKVKMEHVERLKLIRQDIELKRKKQEEADLIKLKQQEKKKRTPSTSSTSSLQPVRPMPVVATDNEDDAGAITIRPQHNHHQMIKKFTKMFEKFYKQNNSLLMFLLLIIGLLLSFRRNKKLLINTLKMIFKVSYV